MLFFCCSFIKGKDGMQFDYSLESMLQFYLIFSFIVVGIALLYFVDHRNRNSMKKGKDGV